MKTKIKKFTSDCFDSIINDITTDCEVMKLLNKAQLISKKLHELDVDISSLNNFDKAILEMSLSPVDRIGDKVYLEFLKKNKIKTISEPHRDGWYRVREKLK